MAVIKVYTRINWLNKSESLTTPLGKTNLNKMDKAINLIDDEVVSMSAKIDEIDTTKVSADQLNNMVTDVSFNDKNGVISITKYNGTVLNIDTAMEKIAVNFEYNAQTQQLILTLENGEKQYIDMSALITQYEFKDTDTIAFSVDSDGKVSASIKSGSITKAMLSSEVMSAITLSENNAAASAQAATQSATNADLDAKLSQSYSVGKSGIRDGEDTDNSKYYSEQAKKYADEAQEIAGGNFIPNSEKGVANGVAVLNANLAVEKAVADEDGNNIQETYATQQQVPTLVKVDDKTITKDEDGTLHGAMSIEVDSELSVTSMNPVQNKVITQALQEKADKSETTVNLLKPTKETSIQDGVTFTNNNDGTYTMSGTATQNAFNSIELITLPKGKYKIVGAPSSYENNLYITKVNDFSYVKYSGEEFEVLDSSQEYSIVLRTYSGSSYTNPVFKPMLTTNLSATYDDFVPYTGDAGSLNGNVAQLQNNKADKTEVPKLVKVDGTTVFLSEDGVLSAKGGGSSIKPKPVSNVSIATTKSKVTIKWTDPTDIVVDGAVLSQWQKTVLMYKQGTMPPTSLNDGTIAVEETTRNQYQSTGYGISLADGNDYSFSLFAISTDGTSSDKVSVSAKLYATLTVTTEEASLYGKAVTVTSGSQNVTGTFSNSGSVTLIIPWMGDTTISATDGTDASTATVNITEYGKSYNAELSFFKIVTFADGTDEEIAAMIEAHYNNKINIADYWAVGDVREIGLSAMSATYVGESHLSGTYKFAIAGFEHDDLTTPINGHTKAAVTLTQVDCLMDISNRNNPINGKNNTENGYMNSSNTNVGGWKECSRRKWCNEIYYNAIISVKDIVKEVNKKTSAGGGSSTIVTTADKIFLLSEIEIYGSIQYSAAGEGNQYQYYKNTVANKYKLPKQSSSAYSNMWWQRSPNGNNDSHFCYVNANGYKTYDNANFNRGIAPCFCI